MQKQEFSLSARIAAVALIVLLIACANVANLLLARATERRREVAVRLAMGISRGRLLRMLVAESLLLAGIAGAAAYVAAMWCGGLLRALLLPHAHWSAEVHGVRTVAFLLAAILFTATATSLAPAFQSMRTDLTAALKSGTREGGGHRGRLRATLVVVQSALAALLVIGAGLFVRSLHNVASQRIGYDADQLVFVSPAVPRAIGALQEIPAVSAFASRVAAVPNVERTAVVSNPPLWGFSFINAEFRANGDSLWHHGQPGPSVAAVSASYFATVGMRMLVGRAFSPGVGAGSPAEVVVNDAMAREFWPGANPIGQCIRFEKPGAPCYTIVGVAENGRRMDMIENPEPQFYLPVGSAPVAMFGGGWVIVRARAGHTGEVAGAVRSLAGRGEDDDRPNVILMSDLLAPQLHAWRLGAWLFAALAALALIVAAMGVYSTLTYATSQRTHELGVRMALGASHVDIARVVVKTGVAFAATGVLLGVALALPLGRLVASLLYGISPRDPLTMFGAAVTLVAVSCVAAAVPAWRATRIDPVVALRAEV